VSIVTKMRDFVGPYRLARLVRAGHSCFVWEAVKDETGERFALKMLKPDFVDDKEAVGYLRHEWEVAKGMKHPHVIRFYDFRTQDYAPFLVLELFNALNLKQVLREGPEPLAYLVDKIVQQTAKGLHYMHERGWVHCDVKPDNLLVNDEGEVKLIDFTIAQRSKRTLKSLLGFKEPVRGTRSYMSPEQIRGETLDRRSDVYGLGCVIFELLSGRPPFTGSSPNELLEKHLRASILDSFGRGLQQQRHAGVCRSIAADDVQAPRESSRIDVGNAAGIPWSACILQKAETAQSETLRIERGTGHRRGIIEAIAQGGRARYS